MKPPNHLENKISSETYWSVQLVCTNVLTQAHSFNPFMPDGNKKVTHTQTKLYLSPADLFKYVWPFCYYQALKG